MHGYYVLNFLVNAVLTVVEIFLGFRFVLKLFGANPTTPFVDWVYDTSAPLLEPFINIFPTPVIEGGYIIEFTTIFALVIYALAAWLLLELLRFVHSAGYKNKNHHPNS